jgi:hypothetical protein
MLEPMKNNHFFLPSVVAIRKLTIFFSLIQVAPVIDGFFYLRLRLFLVGKYYELRGPPVLLSDKPFHFQQDRFHDIRTLYTQNWLV